MKTAANFLDALRVKHGFSSDYQLAKFLGMERQQVGRYRRGRSTFDDTTAARIAEALGIEAGYVMACMAAQRAQTPEARKTWERVAAKVAQGAALALLVTLAYTVSPYSVPEAGASSGGLYIMLNASGVLCALIAAAYLWFAQNRPPSDSAPPESRGIMRR